MGGNGRVAPRTPRRSSGDQADVLVIGAGYLGLSAALHLAEAGVARSSSSTRRAGLGRFRPQRRPGHPGLQVRSGRTREAVRPGARRAALAFCRATADVVFDLVPRHGLSVGARRTAWVQAAHAQGGERARRTGRAVAARGAPVAFLGPAERRGGDGHRRLSRCLRRSRAGPSSRSPTRANSRGPPSRAGSASTAARGSVLCAAKGNGWRAETDGATRRDGRTCSCALTPTRARLVSRTCRADRRRQLAADRDRAARGEHAGASARRRGRCPTRARSSATGGWTTPAGSSWAAAVRIASREA